MKYVDTFYGEDINSWMKVNNISEEDIKKVVLESQEVWWRVLLTKDIELKKYMLDCETQIKDLENNIFNERRGGFIAAIMKKFNIV